MVGRPGMDLWRILVLGVLKQGLGCDFDRIHDLANNHRTVRAMLVHGDFADETRYELQTPIDNVSLMTPELLSAKRHGAGLGRKHQNETTRLKKVGKSTSATGENYFSIDKTFRNLLSVENLHAYTPSHDRPWRRSCCD